MIRVISSDDVLARDQFLSRLSARSAGLNPELMSMVAAVVEQVRTRGDEALIEFTETFDNVRLNVSELRVSADALRQAAEGVKPEFLQALTNAIANVREFHVRQKEESWSVTTGEGMIVGQRILPIDSVGLYVPGGTAQYPSSVVMNVVPAQVAGVRRIVVATPPKALRQNPTVAATLLELGILEVYVVGGAQAIAALAFGTETIGRVHKITGPGNKFVAAAKKLVFGMVGIDAIAGPSEIVIIADDSAPPDFVAADLLAQAEHDEEASAILITTSLTLAEAVADQVKQQLTSFPRRTIAEESLANYGAILLVDNLSEACAIVNELAPEHLELLTSDNDAVAESIRHAGAIFFGPYSPEALGDYLAGPNHVLPTGRTARFSSALGVHDFVKRTSLIRYSREAFQDVAASISVLAEAEGLAGHARSALMRTRDIQLEP
jgi:histidinol dehydrogenase